MEEISLERLALYGVRGINLGGCIKGSPIHPGQPGAMRRYGHAHTDPKDPHYGWLCMKAFSWARIPASHLWHEVGHIFHRSWRQEQCDQFGRSMARKRA